MVPNTPWPTGATYSHAGAQSFWLNLDWYLQHLPMSPEIISDNNNQIKNNETVDYNMILPKQNWRYTTARAKENFHDETGIKNYV